MSGFAAPIGGYSIDANGVTESANPTAEPIWIKLRQNGKKVVAATFPGADGANIRLSNAVGSPIVQSAKVRTVDYTVPFGGFAELLAKGFSLSAGDFTAAPTQTTDQLTAAGQISYSPVLQKTSVLEQFTVGGVNYDLHVAALDTSNDRKPITIRWSFLMQKVGFDREALCPRQVRHLSKPSAKSRACSI